MSKEMRAESLARQAVQYQSVGSIQPYQEPGLAERIAKRRGELEKQLEDLAKVERVLDENPGMIEVMEAIRHLGY